MKTQVTETIPATGQYLSELEVGDWFRVQPTNSEAGWGMRERTLCVLVANSKFKSYHQDALVFVPFLGRSIEMKYGRAIDVVLLVSITAVDARPSDPARELREHSKGGATDGRLNDSDKARD